MFFEESAGASGRMKSMIRLRPQLPTDPAEKSAVKVKGNDKIQVDLPNEPEHTCNNVFNDLADNGAVWSAVGKPALDVMLKGEHAVIVLYGQSGSGKTHTAIGKDEDGIVSMVIKSLAGNGDANLAVLHFHGDVIQDLITGADNLKLKYDDVSGASCDGASTIRIPTSAAGLDHVKKCLEKQAELTAKAGLSNGLCATVYCFGCGEGRLNIIDSYGSQRIWKASTTAEEKKLLGDKNKIVGKLQQTFLDAAVNADPKAIAWKDVKITRFLQAAMSHAMEGAKGYSALVACVYGNASNAHESVCTITFAERAMKLDGLQSVSAYKEIIQNLEDRLDTKKKEEAALQADAKAQEAAALKVKAENEARLQELEDKEASLKVRIQQTKQQAAQEIERVKKENEKKKVDLEKKNQEDLDRLRNLAKNAPQQADIDTKKKIAEVEAEHKEKMQKMNEELTKLKAEIAENKELIAELKELKEEHEKEHAAAMKPVQELEKQLQDLQRQLATAGTSREAGLSEEQIEANRELWEARDELDDLEEEIQRVALECMTLEFGFANEIGKPKPESESESESSSDSDSSDSDSDSDSSDSDSDSDDSEAEREAAAKLQAELKAAKEKEEKEKVDRKMYDAELAHFRETVNKDTFLAELLDKIILYLEYGTNVTVLRDDGNFSRHFMYLSNKRTMMCFGPEAKDTSNVNKGTPQMAYPMAGIQNIIMGQHSKKFQKELKRLAGRVDPPRSEAPPGAEELGTNNMHRYYYRSFTLDLAKDKNGDDQTIDVICDTQTDFEAMVVAYHRLTLKEAYWGKKLYIDFCDEVDKLEPFEKAFCESIHLTPQHYLFTKAKVLETDERLYITLHDLRVISGLDLFHSQRLLELWTKQRWIVRRQVNYFKYQEKLLASAAAAASRHTDPVPAAAAPPAPAKKDNMEDVL